MKSIISFFSILYIIVITSCHNDYVPKKREFEQIDLPVKSYHTYNKEIPYSFEIPDYAIAQEDHSNGAEPYWVNIRYPEMNATLHLSYKTISPKNTLQGLVHDTRMLSWKHESVASNIEEYEIQGADSNTTGLRYEVSGKAATAFQFFLTDNKKHFLRGALYFDSHTEPDSVAPVFNFLHEDAMKLIGSLRWRE
ncbi:MAG: gliding motility lipoprotein GldD [Bacteroidota bacterium]|nr:gliding motility lipoprotein GldD [Bacteroidota bacterium]